MTLSLIVIEERPNRCRIEQDYEATKQSLIYFSHGGIERLVTSSGAPHPWCTRRGDGVAAELIESASRLYEPLLNDIG
jgi:hypothetical protein